MHVNMKQPVNDYFNYTQMQLVRRFENIQEYFCATATRVRVPRLTLRVILAQITQ